MRDYLNALFLSASLLIDDLKEVRFLLMDIWPILVTEFVFIAIGLSLKPTPVEPEIVISNGYGKVFDIYGSKDRRYPYEMTVLLDDGRDVEVLSRNIEELTKTRRICVLEIDTQARVDPIIFRHDPTCEAEY